MIDNHAAHRWFNDVQRCPKWWTNSLISNWRFLVNSMTKHKRPIHQISKRFANRKYIRKKEKMMKKNPSRSCRQQIFLRHISNYSFAPFYLKGIIITLHWFWELRSELTIFLWEGIYNSTNIGQINVQVIPWAVSNIKKIGIHVQ